MTYRNDLDALTARQAALETEVRDRTRELDQARRLVDEINARARLPVLDNIRVAAPCAASWDAMAGDARVRACGDCQKNVYNLSELTREEAESLIREKEGRLCVRYFQRADGTILLKDCAVGVKRRRRRRVAAIGVAAGLAGAALAVRVHQTHGRGFGSYTMGGMESPPQATVGALDLPMPETPAMNAPPSAAPPQVKMGKIQISPGPREIKGELSAAPVTIRPHSHDRPHK